jgi:hypothetical protein
MGKNLLKTLTSSSSEELAASLADFSGLLVVAFLSDLCANYISYIFRYFLWCTYLGDTFSSSSELTTNFLECLRFLPMGEPSSAAVIFLTGDDFTSGALALNKEQQICCLLRVNLDSLARVGALIRVESPLDSIGQNILTTC